MGSKSAMRQETQSDEGLELFVQDCLGDGAPADAPVAQPDDARDAMSEHESEPGGGPPEGAPPETRARSDEDAGAQEMEPVEPMDTEDDEGVLGGLRQSSQQAADASPGVAEARAIPAALLP